MSESRNASTPGDCAHTQEDELRNLEALSHLASITPGMVAAIIASGRHHVRTARREADNRREREARRLIDEARRIARESIDS